MAAPLLTINNFSSGQIGGGSLAIPAQNTTAGSTFDILATIQFQGLAGDQLFTCTVGATGPLVDFQLLMGADVASVQPVFAGTDWSTSPNTGFVPFVSANLAGISGAAINAGGVFQFTLNLPSSGVIQFAGKASHVTSVAIKVAY